VTREEGRLSPFAAHGWPGGIIQDLYNKAPIPPIKEMSSLPEKQKQAHVERLKRLVKRFLRALSSNVGLLPENIRFLLHIINTEVGPRLASPVQA
jgi:hypothetical protein